MKLIELFPEDRLPSGDLLEAGIRRYLKRGLQGTAFVGTMADGASDQGMDTKQRQALNQQT